MARPAKPGGPAKGKGGGLGKKVGPFPVWGWGIILLAGIGLALYLRSHAASSAAVSATPATADTGTTPVVSGGGDGSSDSGGGDTSGGGGSAGPGTVGTFDIGSAFSSLLGANTDLASTAAAAGTQGQAQSYDFASSVFDDAVSLLQTKAQLPSGAGGPGAGGAGKTTSAPSPVTQPFGGILSTRTTTNGTLITTYKNGRVVEQAPGHTAYVAKKGG